MRGGKGLALLLIGLAAILPASAQAQPGGEVTADELVARALADNPDLKAARLAVDAATGRLRQAGLRPNPMLELGGQKALSSDNNLNVGVSLPLDLNGRKEGRVGVAEREIEMRHRQVAERYRDIRREPRHWQATAARLPSAAAARTKTTGASHPCEAPANRSANHCPP